MPDSTQIERLAAAAHALRPDWATRSLVTFLTRHHVDRPYADLAIALAFVATDDRATTPNLLNQHGPWWSAAYTASRKGTETPGPGSEPRCEKDGHEHELARACRCCRAEAIAVRDEDAA
jgi:hypothetical protein